MSNPLLDRLRYHVTGAIERGEGTAIAEIPVNPQTHVQQAMKRFAESHDWCECATCVDYGVVVYRNTDMSSEFFTSMEQLREWAGY